MRARVAFICATGFLLGVVGRSFFFLSERDLVFLFVLGSACVVASVVARNYRFELALLTLFVACTLIGIIRTDISFSEQNPALGGHVGETVTVYGRVTEEPDIREGSTRLTVEVEKVNESTADARMLVVAPPFSTIRYGDLINATGRLREPEVFESGAGRTFDYPMYLMVRGVRYEMSFARVEVVAHGGNPLKRGVLAVKALYVQGLRAVLPEPYAGLAAGITAGDKRSVGSELSETFQRVSLVHILVLSGYNITIVLSAFMGILSRTGRAQRLVVVLLVILFFVVISGGAASAARAGALAFAAIFAKLYGRQFFALRALATVVCGMVFWNPLVLMFDPSFQLSVLATLGLILYSSHGAQVFRFLPERLAIREIAVATVSTQLMVLPLLLYSNGTLSIVSLPANLFALIAVPLGMALSGIAALFGMVFGTYGAVFALPAYLVLRYIIAVADFFASIPYSSVEIPAFSSIVLILVYGGLIGGYLYLERRARVSER